MAALQHASGGKVIEDYSHTLPAIERDQAQQASLFGGELDLLLQKLPDVVRTTLEDVTRHDGGEGAEKGSIVSMDNLAEIYIQSGRVPEAIFADNRGRKHRHPLTVGRCTEEDIAMFRNTFDGDDNVFMTHRKGIAGTLHRLSIIVHPTSICGPKQQPRVIGVTARVGRAIYGTLQKMAPQLLSCTESLLLIGRPGVGKTTVLREFARMLSADLSLVVVVVDKSNELGGDGMTPHDAIGSARWMPVGKRGLQADVLREAVENQTPDVVICDEISTTEEVEAARTMGQRGVRIIASVHGSTLAEVAHCSQRGILLGGQVPLLVLAVATPDLPPASLAQRHAVLFMLEDLCLVMLVCTTKKPRTFGALFGEFARGM